MRDLNACKCACTLNLEIFEVLAGFKLNPMKEPSDEYVTNSLHPIYAVPPLVDHPADKVSL